MHRLIRRIIFAAAILLSLAYFSCPPVWQLRSGSVSLTRWRLDSGATLEAVGPAQPKWLRLEEISLHLLHAVLIAEDERFYEHPGLDKAEIAASLRLNWREGRYVRGASTLTQQLVRLVFLRQEKTLGRKLREMAGALVLEALMSKDEILCWYLNLLPFGAGVYGVEEAAQHYFDSPAELLSVVQAVHLVAILPSPNSWSRDLREQRLSERGRQRITVLLDRLARRGWITTRQRQQAMATADFGAPISARGS